MKDLNGGWGWQYLDPNGDGTVTEDDLMPVIAKRLQTKETVDTLLVCPRPPPWRQPRGKLIVSLANSHINAPSKR